MKKLTRLIWLQILAGIVLAPSPIRGQDAILEQPVFETELDWAGTLLGGYALRDGALVVVDRMTPEPRVYAPDGSLTRILGREGRGPGELLAAWPVGSRGDTLWVRDYGQRRFTYFDRDGRPLGSDRFPIAERSLDDLAMEARWLGADGNWIAQESASTLAISQSSVDSVSLVRVARAGGVLNTIATLSFGSRPVVIPLTGGSVYQVSQPWSWDDQQAVAPDGSRVTVVRQRPDDGSIIVAVETFALSGKLEWAHEVKLPAKRLEEKELDDWARLLYEGISDRVASVLAMRDAIDRVFTPPEFHPAVIGVQVDHGGRVWLEQAPGQWAIVSPDGREFHLSTGLPVTLLSTSEAMLWGQMEDELGIISLVGFRLPSGLLMDPG